MSRELLTNTCPAFDSNSSPEFGRERTLADIGAYGSSLPAMLPGEAELSFSAQAVSSSSTSTAQTFTATSTYSSISGYGLVNAAAALSQITGAPVADVTNLGGTRWFADMVKAPEVWAKGFKGAGVTVAIVDSGIDINHTAFQGQIWRNAKEIAGNGIDDDGNGYADDVTGWDFVQSDNSPLDVYGHGTHVAGIVDQIAPSVKLMAVRVLGNTGSGSTYNIAKGIYYAADNGANVINLSLGSSTPSLNLKTAISYAVSKGCVVAMAAGNSGRSTPLYPAAYANEFGLAVGAVTSSGTMASFSNKSGPTPLDYVVAPGVSIYSTLPGNKWGYKSGTSMASPIVCGVAALMLSANPSLSPTAIENLLTSSAVPLGGTTSTTTTSTTTTNTTLAKSLDLGVAPVLPTSPSTGWHFQPVLPPSFGFGMLGTTGYSSNLFRISDEQQERFHSAQSQLDDLDPLTRQPQERTRRQQRLA